MFDKPFEVTPLQAHPDERGNLFEMLRFKDQEIPGEGYIYCITIVPGMRRGDHYHERKREWSTCTSGEVIVLVEEKDGTKHKVLLSAAKPTLIYFGPYTSHAFMNVSSEIASVISYGSTQHDPNDRDTFPKIINGEGLEIDH